MGMSSDHYRFRSVWRIAADPDEVYATLADVASYPSWWLQVRAARQLDEVSGELRCRCMLPYDLVFVARREVEDPDRRILRATWTGIWQARASGTSRLTARARPPFSTRTWSCARPSSGSPARWPVRRCASTTTG